MAAKKSEKKAKLPTFKKMEDGLKALKAGKLGKRARLIDEGSGICLEIEQWTKKEPDLEPHTVCETLDYPEFGEVLLKLAGIKAKITG